MKEKQYAERDAMALDEAGNHYFRHVLAMTAEQLHTKSDIAAELGWRDFKLEELRGAVLGLLEDVKARYPGQELYCQHMRKLDELTSQLE